MILDGLCVEAASVAKDPNQVEASSHHWDCHLCNYFDGLDRESLVEHLADEHGFCWDCEASFRSYEQHRRKDHNRCADCSQEFATRKALLMHAQVHMERNEECYGCDKMFKSPSGILIHLESRTCRSRVTPAHIEQWAFDSWNSGSYTNHRSSHNKYRCPECDMNFPKVSALLQHVESPACNEDYGAYSDVEALRARIERHVGDMLDDWSDDYSW
ncbi:hypothetical protein H2204_007482 [Knufia peltigerae]|uniref:C2H2-type domain-containing protein n=1 Tax=Knufia peltigerae TaxID=1002370 RepID=A0AA38Y304_9EURO|nr:hypothetical protein H2204_007482 [Knufia peltigerae]